MKRSPKPSPLAQFRNQASRFRLLLARPVLPVASRFRLLLVLAPLVLVGRAPVALVATVLVATAALRVAVLVPAAVPAVDVRSQVQVRPHPVAAGPAVDAQVARQDAVHRSERDVVVATARNSSQWMFRATQAKTRPYQSA